MFVADQIHLVGKIKGEKIFEITQVSYFPLFTTNKELDPILKEQMKILKQHLSNGFFFSYSFDISKCMQ